MASITVSELHPTGVNLFSDPESFLRELSDEELNIQGGLTPLFVTLGFAAGVGVGVAISKLL